MLIYGEPGAGKTTLAGSAAELTNMRDVLLLDVEAGDLSLATAGRDIDVIRITEYRTVARVHEYLKRHCQLRDADDTEALQSLQKRFHQEDLEHVRRYRTVVIDSISEVQKLVMYQLTGVRIGERALDLEPETPQFKEWGQNAEMIRFMVRTFRDLPMHVIFIAQAQIVEDQYKQQIRRPSLPGKLAHEVQGFLDVVGFMQAVPGDEGRMERRLYIQPGKTFQAKNRFSTTTAQFIEAPTLRELLAINKMPV
jgi:hypothetical protein